MPLPKGAKLDVKTGKFKLPPGHVKKHSNDGKAPKPSPATRHQRIERNNELVRQTARQGFKYVLFALYPSGREYVGEVEEPSFEAIARTYGGGKFEVWKADRTTGEYVGDPTVYPVDKAIYPPRLAGFNVGALPAGPVTGFNMWAAQSGNPAPGGMPPWMQAPPPGPGPSAAAVKLEELEEELEEAEDEITRLKNRLAEVEREKDTQARDHERALAEIQRKEEFRAMLAEFKGDKKDPLAMLLDFKRVEAELAGPLKAGQTPMDALQSSVAMFSTMMELSKKFAPDNGGGGGMELFAGLANKLLSAKAAAPDVIELPAKTAPPVMPEPTAEQIAAAKENQARIVSVGKVFRLLTESARVLWKDGAMYIAGHPEPEPPAPEELAQLILEGEGPDFDVVRSIVKVDNPENALQVFIDTAPDLVATDERKKWIVAAFAHAQGKLLS